MCAESLFATSAHAPEIARHSRAGMGQPTCRLCGIALSQDLLDLGTLPLVHAAFVPPGTVIPSHPLCLRMCDDCRLVQVVAPVASASVPEAPPTRGPHAADHVARHAAQLRQKWRLGRDSRVVHVGHDGGGLLRHFQDAGVAVLSLDPSGTETDLPTEVTPLTTDTAMDIAVRRGRADLVIVDEMLTRVRDLFDFAAGLAGLLRPNGVLLITVPHLLPLLQQVRFDCFRHDVCSYLSLSVLERVLCSVGLRVFDAERLPEDGPLLRVHACATASRHTAKPGLKVVRMAETMAEVERRDLYTGFAGRVSATRDQICAFLGVRQAGQRRLAAYGATSRGAMLLNLCDAEAQDLLYVVDPNPQAAGQVLVGSSIPIRSLQALSDDPPDDLLLLPGNSPHEVMTHLHPLRQTGMQFWTLLPRIARI